ncbi:MAG: transcription antitermination protein NusB [Alistipes sp.]|nr:transcription antitermination protein NusB [Alistipes sp.]
MLSRRLLRVKVVKSVYAHLQTESDNIPTTEKNLIASIDKAYDLYFHLLSLLPELVRYAEERQEIARNKMLPTYEDLNPNRKFVENKAIARIESCEAINNYCTTHGLRWREHTDLIKNLYQSLLEQDFYKSYMANTSKSFREDAELAANIYLNILEENELLESVLEEQSILWSDDLGYILTMVARTVSSMRESHEQIKLMPKFKSDEDLDFAKKLLHDSIVHFADNRTLIDNYTNNWDIERLALMDIVILGVAISEAKTFSSIPVKVTLNEYIDIAKYYSTPASSLFINGVLDKVITKGLEDGSIVKMGKGLL